MVSTPLVVVRTHDPFATTKAIAAAFGEKKDSLPFLSWDAIRGLQGLTDVGANAVIDMLKPSGTSERRDCGSFCCSGRIVASDRKRNRLRA